MGTITVKLKGVKKPIVFRNVRTRKEALKTKRFVGKAGTVKISFQKKRK